MRFYVTSGNNLATEVRIARVLRVSVKPCAFKTEADCVRLKKTRKKISITWEKTDEKHGGIHTVYVLGSPITGKMKYVGRTINLSRRLERHRRPGSKTASLVLLFYIPNLSYEEARGYEQTLMRLAHTKGSIDEGFLISINGVSQSNPRAQEYFDAYKNSLAQMDEVDISYIENQLDNE